MTIKVLIADDEPPARMRLSQMLTELPDYEVVGEADHGIEVLKLCETLAPDIVLLDIRMPDMDGLEAARHLAELNAGPAVIFTTAFDHYAIDAFDAQAIAYLLKPVRQERLVRALERAAQLSKLQLKSMALEPDRPTARRNICVRRASDLQLIPVEEILYFQADQKYVTVRHRNGEDLIDEPLKDIAEEFAGSFIRVHRSVLIAFDYLDRLEKSSSGHYQIRLKNSDESLPVSRRHIGAVKARLKHKN